MVRKTNDKKATSKQKTNKKTSMSDNGNGVRKIGQTKKFKNLVMENQDKLELQNLMLTLALEAERISGLTVKLTQAQKSARSAENQIDIWKNKYNKKLNIIKNRP